MGLWAENDEGPSPRQPELGRDPCAESFGEFASISYNVLDSNQLVPTVARATAFLHHRFGVQSLCTQHSYTHSSVVQVVVPQRRSESWQISPTDKPCQLILAFILSSGGHKSTFRLERIYSLGQQHSTDIQGCSRGLIKTDLQGGTGNSSFVGPVPEIPHFPSSLPELRNFAALDRQELDGRQLVQRRTIIMLRLLTVPVALATFLLQASAQNLQDCYGYDGAVQSDNVVCEGSGACCNAQATCTEQRLCHNEGDPENVFVRGPCSSRNWDGSICPQLCLYGKTRARAVTRWNY